ncbi:uncharacterized protein LOC122139310 [Cyprinus carpio]|uniref:Gypsy retrotransposon integrase-like protein 1 n=1 Tax=Cyprinus carpio TaxID=7962 RepID=A0A9R0AAX9_CYPCA|nr:uncharacterized protein LOC122139310 [Cyprinus carpio]
MHAGGCLTTSEQAGGSRTSGRAYAHRTTPPFHADMSGRLHRPPHPTWGAPRAEVKVNGHQFEAVLDSGSAVSLVHPTVLYPRPKSRAHLAITCVHRDTQEVAARRVTILASPGSWPVEVGIVKDLPVPMHLGRDWPRFDHLLLTATQPANPPWEPPKTPTSKGRPTSFCAAGLRHLRAQHTIQQIRDRFHWPSLDAEVKRVCQACPTCQQMSPRTPPPSPLIPLPIIEVPFKRIGMDLVGPLPKSAQGHEHILVIVDYATRYPEAIPLRKATANAIA